VTRVTRVNGVNRVNVLFARLLRRDLLAHWRQFAAAAAMALLAVVTYAGLEGAWNGLRVHVAEYAAESNLADVWVRSASLDDADVTSVESLPGVTGVEARRQVTARLGGAWAELTVVPETGFAISRPSLSEGEAITGDGEGLWLAATFAEDAGLAPGDPVTLTVESPQLGATTLTTTLAGTYQAPGKMHYTGGAGYLLPDPHRFTYGLVTAATLGELAGHVPVTGLVVTATDPAAAETAIADTLGDHALAVFTRTENPSIATAYNNATALRDLSVVFSLVFAGLALLTVSTSLRRLADTERRQIATLRALGYSRRRLTAHYAAMGLLPALTGALAGLALAPLLSQIVLTTQKPQLDLPTWGIAYTPVTFAAVTLTAAAGAAGGFLAARRLVAQDPAGGLNPAAPSVARPRPLRLPRRLSPGVRWVLRDSISHTTRLAMAVTGVAGGVALMFASFGLGDTIKQATAAAFDESGDYSARVDLATPALDDATRAALGRSAQLVETVPVELHPGDGLSRVLTVVGPGAYYGVADTDGAVHTNFGAGDVLLSEGSADGVTVGETIGLGLPGTAGRPLSVKVTALTTLPAPQGVVLGQAAWEALGRTFAPTYALVGPDADLDALRASPDVTGVATKAEQRDNGTRLVGILMGVAHITRALAVLLVVIVLTALGSLTFAERAGQYSLLRALSLTGAQLRRLSALDNVGATVLGLAVGLPAGWWVLRVHVAQFDSSFQVWQPHIGPWSIAVSLTLTAATALLATALLTRRLRGLDLVGQLKRG
jgi:putative ABC transport system permease protein